MVTDKCISANDMQIHQLKGDMPTFINSLIHPFAILQFLTAESCFLSYILLSVGIIKYVQTTIALTSVSQHDDVSVLR